MIYYKLIPILKQYIHLKIKSLNNFYFHWTKRPNFKGKGKFDKIEKIFIITEPCQNKNLHNALSYEKLSKLIREKNNSLIDFSLKKN